MKQEFVTLPREVVRQALDALDEADLLMENRQDIELRRYALVSLRAALEQPQRKLTPQDIADSALLGNIESPFNACMHQEHCERWKAQAEQHVADHQRESSIDNDLPSENGQLITTSSSVPFGYKLAPVEPTVEMMDAGGAATRRCYQHLNKDEVMCSYVYRHMLAAAPQPPALEQQVEKESTCKESLQAEQEPVAYGLFRKDSSEIEWDADHVFSNEPWGVMYDDEEVRPLYTSPHPKREPLTHYEIHELFRRSWDYCQDGDEIKAFARAIEAAHGITEGKK